MPTYKTDLEQFARHGGREPTAYQLDDVQGQCADRHDDRHFPCETSGHYEFEVWRAEWVEVLGDGLRAENRKPSKDDAPKYSGKKAILIT